MPGDLVVPGGAARAAELRAFSARAAVYATRPCKKAAAAGHDNLRRLLATRRAADTPLGARNRALLLIGYGVALGDVTPVSGCGLRLLVRPSKTDQHGAG